MTWVAGADGCKGGWLRASRELGSGELRFDLIPCANGLLEQVPTPRTLGIDVPIGLTDRGPRLCDQLARQKLGRLRGSSVFPTPIRPALRAPDRQTASRITQARDGRRVGAQAFGIYPKIREVDELLQGDRTARGILIEVHPEVSFRAWARGRTLSGKKTTAGRRERLRLAERWLGAGLLARARGRHPRSVVGDDDILDAVAALWTAVRIVEGRAQTLPEEPPEDRTGLRMEIVY